MGLLIIPLPPAVVSTLSSPSPLPHTPVCSKWLSSSISGVSGLSRVRLAAAGARPNQSATRRCRPSPVEVVDNATRFVRRQCLYPPLRILLLSFSLPLHPSIPPDACYHSYLDLVRRIRMRRVVGHLERTCRSCPHNLRHPSH